MLLFKVLNKANICQIFALKLATCLMLVEAQQAGQQAVGGLFFIEKKKEKIYMSKIKSIRVNIRPRRC